MAKAKTKILAFGGSIGGPFVLTGYGLEGEVRIDGRLIKPTFAGERRVKGQVPDDLKPGEVTVSVGSASLKARLV